MDQQKIDLFLMNNMKFFPSEKMPFLKEKLKSMDDDKFMLASSIQLKDPTVLLLISLFLGGWGVDRFMLGETGLGVAKLLTFAGCGIWALVDLFTVSKRTKEQNFMKIMTML